MPLVYTDEEMEMIIEHHGSKTIEMPLIKVQNLNAKIEELKTEKRKLKQDNTRLQKEVDRLRSENTRLRDERLSHNGTHALFPTQKMSREYLDRRLKQLIALCHPDKHLDNALAHEVTVALNKLREEIRR